MVVVNLFWGSVMMGIGLFMLVCGTRKSNVLIYRIISAPSRRLWGDNVHRFYQAAGTAVIVAGVLMLIRHLQS